MANEIILTTDSRPYKSLITDIGNAKMTRAILEGRKVNIVEMRLGDGGGSYYMPATAATALVNEVWTGEIASKTINEASPNIIAVKTVIPSTVGGFTIREASLHDDEGDMIAVCNMPEIAKATLPDGISSSLDIVMNILLSNVDAVEFVINPTLDPASRGDLNMLIDSLAVRQMDLTIPAAGWTRNGTGRYPFRRDVPVATATEAMIPSLTVLQAGEDAAIACGLCPRAQTLDGAVRVFAASAPTADIPVSLTLQGDASGYLPSNTSSVRAGAGLKMAQDGTISVDAATDEEVQEMLAEVLASDNK